MNRCVRLADDFLYDAITIIPLRVCEPVKQNIFLWILGQVSHIPLFLMVECFAIGDQKLKVARVGRVNMGIINLVDDSVAQGEPKTRRSFISGSDPLFGAGCPSRGQSQGRWKLNYSFRFSTGSHVRWRNKENWKDFQFKNAHFDGACRRRPNGMRLKFIRKNVRQLDLQPVQNGLKLWTFSCLRKHGAYRR